MCILVIISKLLLNKEHNPLKNGVFFCVFLVLCKQKDMSLFLKELIDLFQLKKINFRTANRKTLDSFVKSVDLQQRRQAMFEAACDHGKKKSRVALCKKKGRPEFSKELSTFSTKKLRGTILDFIKELGLDNYGSLENKDEKALDRIAHEKGWERVLYIVMFFFDESKIMIFSTIRD